MTERESKSLHVAKKRDTSLLRWVKDSQKAGECDMIVHVQEDNMHTWDVVLTAKDPVHGPTDAHGVVGGCAG